MIKYLLILSLVSISFNTIAQPAFQWAKRGAGNTNDFANAVVTDANGNSYMTGSCGTNGIIFGTDTLADIGANFYLVKYDASGNVVWARNAGGPGSEAGWGIDLDSQGNVYVCGMFSQSGLTFGSFVLNNNGASPTTDIFVAKYDTAGNVLNAFSIGGTANDNAFAIKVDASGYCHMVGSYFSPSVDFGPVTVTNADAISDVYIAMFDPSGNLLWVRTAPDASGLAIDVDANTNTYITGRLAGMSVPFGNDTLSSAGGNDFYIARLDAAGNFVWARSVGGTGDDSGDGIAVDGDGNCYVTGSYRSAGITFGTQFLPNMGGGQYSDLFLVKYDQGGNVIWARRAGLTSTEEGTGLRADDNGNAYVSGIMGNQPFIMGSTMLTSYGGSDALVAKYDSSGNVMWALNAGGASQDDAAALGIDAIGNIYLAGTYFSQPANFGNTILANAGARDVYLAKVDVTVSLPEGAILTPGITVYPLPAQTEIFINSAAQLTRVTLLSLTGQTITEQLPLSFQIQLNIKDQAPGFYLLRIETTQGITTRKIVKSESLQP